LRFGDWPHALTIQSRAISLRLRAAHTKPHTCIACFDFGQSASPLNTWTRSCSAGQFLYLSSPRPMQVRRGTVEKQIERPYMGGCFYTRLSIEHHFHKKFFSRLSRLAQGPQDRAIVVDSIDQGLTAILQSTSNSCCPPICIKLIQIWDSCRIEFI